MKIYLFLSTFIGFILGIASTLLFVHRDSIKNQIFKVRKSEPITTFEPGSQLYKVNLLLEEVKAKKKLPIRLSKQVLESLIIIAKTKNWQKELDKETLGDLEKIYNKWQISLKRPSNKNKVASVSKAYGFDEPHYWEGTIKEYDIAKEKGLIKENTIISIIMDEKDYHGSYYSINEDGSTEEYMK